MSVKYDYDVLYLGSGHAAFDGASMVGVAGKKVAIVEKEKVGGTCPNWGCNAKILLEYPAELRRQIQASNGVVEGSGEINWAKNQAHKRAVLDTLPDVLQGIFEGFGITYLFGDGKFVDAHTIQIGDKQVTADKIVIASGARSSRLDIEGADLLHDSKDFLALEEMPKHLTIVGAGYIGMESASMAAAAGSQVTVIMYDDKPLHGFYQKYANEVVAHLEKEGVVFITNANTTAIEKTGEGLVAKTSAGDLKADWILDATGRVPNVENIGLDEIGVKYNKHGVIVNDHLQTSVDNVYAAGDVLSKTQPKLTPTATFESKYLSQLFLGQTTDAIDYPTIATNLFTSPRLAQAGVTVDAALTEPDKYKVVEKDVMNDWYRQVDYEEAGKITLVYDQQGHLVGATELSEHAENIINSLLPAIEFGFTPAQLGRLVTIFPTFGYSAFSELS